MTWIAIVAVGAISYGFRALPLAVLGRAPISERVDRTLRHAAAAAQAALLVGAVQHGMTATSSSGVIAATAVSLVMAMRRATMLRIVGAGGLAYAALTAGQALAS